MSIISVKDMCLWYGDQQALKNVNIEIPEKNITAFIGHIVLSPTSFSLKLHLFALGYIF